MLKNRAIDIFNKSELRFISKLTICFWYFFLLIGSGSKSANGQTASNPPVYSFVAIGTPLSDAFDQLIERTGINVAFEIDLVEGRKAFCRASDVTLEEVLRCVLKDTGLDFFRLSSGTYVVIREKKAEPQFGGITGRVVDSESGEPLPSAHVLLADAGTGDVTNNAGRFSFPKLVPGPHRIVVTYVGYQDFADTIRVEPDQATPIELSLHVEPLLAAPILITGLTRRLPSEALAEEEGDIETLTQAPGRNDVIRSMHTIIGLRVGDAMADVHVQGGAAGEHQYRLDGAPVFIPIPNGGIVGPFSPFAIDKFTLHKAGFGATKGSHLSGVIEAEHRLTPLLTNLFDVQIDPLGLNARAMGSVGAQGGVRANWMVAGRKGLWSLYQPSGLADHFSAWSAPDLFLLQALAPTALQGDQSKNPGYGSRNSFEAAGDLLRSRFNDRSFQDTFDFYDIHSAVRLHMGPMQSLHASFYRGGNELGDEELVLDRGGAPIRIDDPDEPEEDEEHGLSFKNAYKWNNTVGQLRYEKVLGNRTFAEWGVWYSGFDLSQEASQSEFDLKGDGSRQDSLINRFPKGYITSDSLTALGFGNDDRNAIGEVGLRSVLNHAIGSRHFLTGGIEGVRTASEFLLYLQSPRNLKASTARQATLQTSLWRWGAYLEDRFNINAQTLLNVGVRLTYLNNHTNIYAEPRISIRHDAESGIFGPWAVNAAVGLYRQFINQFDVASLNVNAVLPGVRFWLPLGDDISPSRAVHASGSYLLMPATEWQLRLESYYKWQPHTLVIDYANPMLFRPESVGAPLRTQQDLLTDAEGYAYGLAARVERKTDLYRISMQYEYSVAEQRIANRFGGASVSVPWNVPHRISAGADLALTDQFSIMARLDHEIGRAWAFRDAYYNYLEPDPNLALTLPFDLSDPESHGLSPITKIDLGFAYTRPIKNTNLQVRLDLQNLLSSNNVEEWSLLYNEALGVYRKVERPLTPFLSSLVVRLGW